MKMIALFPRETALACLINRNWISLGSGHLAAALTVARLEGPRGAQPTAAARLIDGDDNEAGGNSTYTVNRMLDGDPSYVRITP